MRTRLALLGAVFLAGAAWADPTSGAGTSVAVDTAGGEVAVNVKADKVAVFQPAPNQVWVVASGGRKVSVAPSVAARSGWTVESLRVESGAGVKITGPAARSWKVGGGPGNWTVSQGAPKATSRRPSMIVLRDGLAGAVAVGDADGHRYKVVPVTVGAVMEPARLEGIALAATVQGAVQEGSGGAVAMAKVPVVAGGPANLRPVATPDAAVADIEPAAGEPAKAVEEERIASVVPLPMTADTPVPQAAAKPLVITTGKAKGQVAFEEGPKLKAVATPVETKAAKVENLLPPVAARGPRFDKLGQALAVYRPGTLVSFTLPEEFKLENGRLVRKDGKPASVRKRELDFARAYGATQDAALRAEKVAATLKSVRAAELPINIALHDLVTPSPDEVTSGTEVSATAALDETREGLFPATGAAREYWPGLKQRLADLTLATDKAGARIAPLEASVSATALKEAEAHKAPEAAPLPKRIDEVAGTSQPAWQKSPAEVASNPQVVAARRALASYQMVWQRPDEAATELALQPQRADGLPDAPEDRFLLALSLVARGRGVEAVPLLRQDASYLRPDRALWLSTAYQQSGQSAVALQSWPTGSRILMHYPGFLRRMAQRKHAEALVAVGNREDAVAFIDDVVTQFPGDDVPGAWRRLQGLARLGGPDEQKGLAYLAQAADDMRDPESAYHAKFDFVQALLRRGELENQQVTNYLEDLRMFWRGDDLEQQVLNQLGEYYLRQQDYRNALNRWRTLVRVYPKTPGMAGITDKMTQAILGVFDPENPKQYDALTYLGLYFDFRELLPPDERGDRVMERAGKILLDTGMPERAIPVLEQVLEYRAEEPIDQARLALLLAEAYRLNGKPDMALKTLDKWRKKATNTVQQEAWPLAEARALVDLKRPAEAYKVVKDSNEPEAVQIKSEVGWQTRNWTLLRDVLEPVVARTPVATLPDGLEDQVNVLRLAYAYGQLGQQPQLQALLKRFAEPLSRLPTVQDNLAAIATQAGVARVGDAGRPLADVATALGGLNTFTDQFRMREEDVQRRKKERDEYNDKMKYMDLLPPPTL